MQYRLRVTREASEDVTGLAGYIARKFANIDAALNFLDKYDKEVQRLTNFPFGYRGVSVVRQIRCTSSMQIRCT